MINEENITTVWLVLAVMSLLGYLSILVANSTRRFRHRQWSDLYVVFVMLCMLALSAYEKFYLNTV